MHGERSVANCPALKRIPRAAGAKFRFRAPGMVSKSRIFSAQFDANARRKPHKIFKRLG
jgi:hypothetical protein